MIRNMYTINEQAMTRDEAFDRCVGLGEQFVNHFDKVYNDNNEETIHHHAKEMQAFLNKVNGIVLKSDKSRPLSIDKKIDWFFTVGSDAPTLFKDNEEEAHSYEDFMDSIVKTNDVLESLKEVGLYYGDSKEESLEMNITKPTTQKVEEDTIKTKKGKWVNKGKEGTHGEFKTKKAADAQRKAMFAKGFTTNEALVKNKLREKILDALDFLSTLEYESAPEKFGGESDWDDIATSVRLGDFEDYEMAEAICEYLEGSVKFNKNHPQVVEDDPQAQYENDIYDGLKREMEKYKADYGVNDTIEEDLGANELKDFCPNLINTIEKLNKKDIYGDDNIFNFVIRYTNDHTDGNEEQLIIYDKNEEYSLYFGEDFGDWVEEALNKACEKDFGKGSYVDWYDTTVMIVDTNGKKPKGTHKDNYEEISLEDFVKDSIIVVTDDVNDIDGEWVAKQYQADDFDECLFESSANNQSNVKVVVNKEAVDKVISDIANKNVGVVPRFKNKEFMKNNGLSSSDVVSILKQLEVGDYSYSVSSNNALYIGNTLTVFITGKEFKLSNGRTLNNLVMYIKIDDSDEGKVTIVSIHKSEHPEEETHPYRNTKQINDNLKEDIYDDDFSYEDSDFDDDEVRIGATFYEDGREYEWVAKSWDDDIYLDFDHWQVWEAKDVETGEHKWFVVDPDISFIDWGPVDSFKEAHEFYQSKIDDYEDENSDDDYDLLYDIDDTIDNLDTPDNLKVKNNGLNESLNEEKFEISNVFVADDDFSGIDGLPSDIEDNIEDYTTLDDIEDTTPKGPDAGADTGIANTLIEMINGEWDTIEKYNSLLATLAYEDKEEYKDIAKVIEDINNEENAHVGQLQKALETLSPNTATIKDGEEEAQEQLNEALDDNALDNISEQDIAKIKEEIINAINEAPQDEKSEWTNVIAGVVEALPEDKVGDVINAVEKILSDTSLDDKVANKFYTTLDNFIADENVPQEAKDKVKSLAASERVSDKVTNAMDLTKLMRKYPEIVKSVLVVVFAVIPGTQAVAKIISAIPAKLVVEILASPVGVIGQIYLPMRLVNALRKAGIALSTKTKQKKYDKASQEETNNG